LQSPVLLCALSVFLCVLRGSEVFRLAPNIDASETRLHPALQLQRTALQ
jgi:hypothetical protein